MFEPLLYRVYKDSSDEREDDKTMSEA